MAQAVARASARRDFIIHYAYIAEKAGIETARRFRQAVERTYTELADMPEMGWRGKVRRGKHQGVRIWRVRGFEEYLIAYRPRSGGVAIERLVHAKQDYERVLK